MRITHISTELHGGAGMGAVRLHRALLESGIDSRMVCSRADDGDLDSGVSVVGFGSRDFVRTFAPAVLNKLGIWKSPYYRGVSARECSLRDCKAKYTPSQTLFRVERVPAVRRADIVHLHWVCGFLDVPSFFRRCGKPVVWTLRDEWPLLGGFHYRTSVPEKVPPEVAADDRRQAKMKHRVFSERDDVYFVALSDEMAAFAKSSTGLPDERIVSIPNPVSPEAADCSVCDIGAAKAGLGIPPRTEMVLFVAQHLGESRKGFRRAVEAVRRLKSAGRDVVLAAIGRPTTGVQVPEGTLLPGFVESQERLLDWYRAADAFVNPSLSEGCCKTLLDAGACGVPCVAFPHSGAREAIGNTGGIVTENFSVDALVSGLRCVLDGSWDRQRIRDRALTLFSPQAIARRHVDFYTGILERPFRR